VYICIRYTHIYLHRKGGTRFADSISGPPTLGISTNSSSTAAELKGQSNVIHSCNCCRFTLPFDTVRQGRFMWNGRRILNCLCTSYLISNNFMPIMPFKERRRNHAIFRYCIVILKSFNQAFGSNVITTVF
jgi:hypothetical protein